MKWEKVKLGNVTDSCLGKMLDQNKNKGDYQPYLANVNVRWGEFDLEDLPLMKFEESEQERYELKYGDLVICEGGKPGRCAIWKEQIPNMKIQKALHRVRVHDCLDYRYLFYWFLLAGKTGELDQYFTGATIKHMPGQKLKEVVIDKPPLEIQHRIADILSAYDDLIENNQKQIKLLEEAAQRLYKEWFVDLRFPGHENTKIVDGVPEGWQYEKLGALTQTTSGGTPSRRKSEYYVNGSIKWVKTKELNDGFIFETEESITEDAVKNSSAKILPGGTLMVAMYGATIGKIGITASEMACNQACCAFISYDGIISRGYLYCWLMENRNYLISQGKGAAQPNLSQEVIKNFSVLCPDKKIMNGFTRIVTAMLENKRVLENKKLMLLKARDDLLPKLMSGEVEV